MKDYIPITLGFDSARGVLAEIAGNISLDALSSGKFYHLVRCGGTAITLEVALQIEPTVVLINEEIQQEKISLKQIVDYLARVISERREKWGRRSGIILVSDDFIEALDQVPKLKSEIKDIRHTHPRLRTSAKFAELLTDASRELFMQLPSNAKHSLTHAEDGNGNPLLPSVDPEKLLAELLETTLTDNYNSGDSFIARYHHISPEGRCPVPTQFDATLGWALGHCAAALVQSRKTGYLAALGDLLAHPTMWNAYGVPLATLFSSTAAGPTKATEP